MDTYQIVLNAAFFLAGAGLAAWFIPWLIDRGAYTRGWEDRNMWDDESDVLPEPDPNYVPSYPSAGFDQPVDLTERLKPYSRVDPPNAEYPTY